MNSLLRSERVKNHWPSSCTHFTGGETETRCNSCPSSLLQETACSGLRQMCVQTLTLQMEAGMRPTMCPVLSRAQHTVGVKDHGGLGFPGQSLSCPLEPEYKVRGAGCSWSPIIFSPVNSPIFSSSPSTPATLCSLSLPAGPCPMAFALAGHSNPTSSALSPQPPASSDLSRRSLFHELVHLKHLPQQDGSFPSRPSRSPPGRAPFPWHLPPSPPCLVPCSLAPQEQGGACGGSQREPVSAFPRGAFRRAGHRPHQPLLQPRSPSPLGLSLQQKWP